MRFRPRSLNRCWATSSPHQSDLTVGCVIVTGAGEGFSSGGNVKRMNATPTPSARRLKSGGITPRASSAFRWPCMVLRHPRLRRSMVRRWVLGCDLATMCDIRIAARSAKFGKLSARGSGVRRWRCLVSAARSRSFKGLRMTFTGDFVDATEGRRIGLVSRVVDDAALMDEAMALARKIAAQPVHALRLSA